MQVEDHQILEENVKKSRRRKKNLYNSILQQMEFYFSDANINKDRFIRQLIETDPYIELSTFLKFNKILALTNKVDEIATALEKSEVLKLSEDKQKVCRITPIKQKTNEDECTIYVERLPDDTEHDWLKELFSYFGTVDYVSLPKYKHNKRNKGFAFIEFSEQECAQKAITYFESIGCKLPTQMPPNQLASIVTFESENSYIKNEENKYEDYLSKNEPPEDKSTNKTNPIHEKSICETETKTKKKKRKLLIDNEESAAKKVKTDDENVDESDVQDENDVSQPENKKKRKRKKSKKNGFDFKQIGVQVLSKREWKQLRNKYLNMQRLKMKSLKDHLFRNRHNANDNRFDANCELKTEKQEGVESEARFKFTPGCIIKFTVPETCTDTKKLKSDLRQYSGVEFVDVQPGKEIGFLRFSDNNSTEAFIKSSDMESANILEGQEEKEYWDKIIQDREAKLKKNPGKKVRGREKLLKKAEQELGKHIRFESI